MGVFEQFGKIDFCWREKYELDRYLIHRRLTFVPRFCTLDSQDKTRINACLIQKCLIMGKGDKKTKRGKIASGTYGARRKRKSKKVVASSKTKKKAKAKK